MQTGVVACCLLTVWLLGCQGTQSIAEEVAPQLLEAPAEAVPSAPVALPAAESPALAPAERPGLLSLFTLGAAVIGAFATPTGACRSDACLAASIIDKTAQLEAVRGTSLASVRARAPAGSARN